MLADALARLRERAASMALPDPVGRLGRTGRPWNHTAFPLPAATDPLGRAGRSCEREPDQPSGLPALPKPNAQAGRPKSRQNQSSPQSPRSPRQNDVSGAATWSSWDDVDSWRRFYAQADTLEGKREVVRQRAVAAGGNASDGGIALPAELRRCLGLAELKTQAYVCGLAVTSLTSPCLRCGDEAEPGGKLCPVCLWLSGDRA
jgi:hypothetical protein